MIVQKKSASTCRSAESIVPPTPAQSLDGIMDNDDNFDSPAAVMAMRRRHLELGLRMQAVALRALHELERKAEAGQPLNLSAEDAKTLFDAGAKLERTALGRRKQEGDDESIAASSPKKPN